MFRNFRLFIAAVADHWIFWVALFLMIEPYLEGATPAAWKSLRDFFSRHPTGRRRLFRLVGVLALFVATFQAWNTEYEGRIAAEGVQATGPIEKRFAMKDLIGTAISEEENLGKDWSKKDDEPFVHDTNVWTNKVGHMIEDAYGKGEVSLWMSDAGFVSYSDGKKRTDVHNWIIHRLERLNELIKRVDTLRMTPGFDPKTYRWVETCDSC